MRQRPDSVFTRIFTNSFTNITDQYPTKGGVLNSVNIQILRAVSLQTAIITFTEPSVFFLIQKHQYV